MIQGFHLRFTSDELRAHLLARGDHHDNRAATKEAELPALREVAAKIKPSMGAPQNAATMGKMYSNTTSTVDVDHAIESIEEQVRDHRNKAVVFRLFASHLYAEDYDLQESDLRRLEILK